MGPSFPQIDKTIFWSNSYGVLDGETLGSDLIINNSTFDISDVELTNDINIFAGSGINSNDNPLFVT